MSVVIPPGLYTIQCVLKEDTYIPFYASARRETGSHVFGVAEISPEFIQQWHITPVFGGHDTYGITAPGENLGWSIDPAEPIQPGSHVVLSETAKGLRIQHVADESRGSDEQAYSIMIPINIEDSQFYLKQSRTLPTYPPLEVVYIPDPPSAPIWIIKRVHVD